MILYSSAKVHTKYVNIYRSISKLSYIDRYMTANIDRYMKIFKNHFSIDICRNFHFLSDIWKFYFFFKITISGFYSLVRFMKTSYIGQYNDSYIGQYKKRIQNTRWPRIYRSIYALPLRGLTVVYRSIYARPPSVL